MQVILAQPRGFCAGVTRAIDIVDRALAIHGAPVHVFHEIVHNQWVVDDLRARGAVFVDAMDDVPANAVVVFSAHGVSRQVVAQAKARGLHAIDATCPLVSKVHIEANRHFNEGREIVLIGHAGHVEVIGTMGQLPEGAITLLETVADAERFVPRDPENLAFVTQTTLSVDDTREIVETLRRRFPAISLPHKEDICYATTNRQAAVKAIAAECDAMLVIGAPNSSNSLRLVEVAQRSGCLVAQLVQRAGDIDWAALADIRRVGITAGASAPEVLVEEVIDAFRQRYSVTLREVTTATEAVQFKLPGALDSNAA